MQDEQWNLSNGGKRRRNSPEAQTQTYKKRQTSIKDYWLGNPTNIQNRFNALQEGSTEGEETEKKSNDSEAEKSKNANIKAPPIFVSNVETVTPLKEMLGNIAGDAYTLKILANNEVKILLHSPELYVSVIEKLKNKNTEFYTYQLKQDRCYKVVLRGLHQTTDLDEIKNELKELGHKVVRITNIRSAITKKQLPLFFIELASDLSNKKIFEIQRLLNSVVSFEPPRKKRDIPQCLNCQELGHTKNYCYKSPACVKCAKNHLTKDCPIKHKIKEVVCANCGQDHPASYKGCIVRKQLQQKLFPTLRSKYVNNTTTQTTNINKNYNVKSDMSFAQVVNKNNSNTEELESQTRVSTLPVENKLETMMCQLMTRMDTMLNLLTCLINKISK